MISVQDFLDAHLEDHVGVCADPRVASCCITAKSRRGRSEFFLGGSDRPRDPDEHAIHCQKLIPDLFGNVVGIDRWFGVNVECRQFPEDAVKAIVLGVAARFASRSAPKNGDFKGPFSSIGAPPGVGSVGLGRLARGPARTFWVAGFAKLVFEGTRSAISRLTASYERIR